MREILRYWPAAAFGVPALGGAGLFSYGQSLDMKHNATPGAEQLGFFSKGGHNTYLQLDQWGLDEVGAISMSAAGIFFVAYFVHAARRLR